MDYQQVQTVEETNYAEVYNSVIKGKEVYVTFGLSIIPAWAPATTKKGCDTIPGGEFANGVYRCWNEGGVPKFQRLVVPTVTYPSPCANGVCPRR